jgi:hypothetical protein
MYQFSRAIYREIADEIIEAPERIPQFANHGRVLRACEGTVKRLATDRLYFARPARRLFGEIRWFFPLTSQLRVLRVIEHYLGLVDEFVRNLPNNGLDANGNPLRCRASTRKGSPCQRTSLPTTAIAHPINTWPRPKSCRRRSPRSRPTPSLRPGLLASRALVGEPRRAG